MTALSVAIAAATHRTRDDVLLEPRAMVFAGAGTPLVGVVEEAHVRAATLQRHVQRAQRQCRSLSTLIAQPTTKRE